MSLVMCGSFMDEDGCEVPVHCNPHTGDLIIQFGIRGNVIVGNVSVTEPTDMSGIDLTQLYNNTGGKGVAMTRKYFLVFRDDVVEYRLRTSPLQVEHTVTYDLDAEYEGVIDDDF